VRREWRSRLVDHDGEREGDGGIARWLKLTDGLGLDRDYVTSLHGLLPGTRFAVDAYVRFVREKTLLEAIASSLTEMFSPVIINERMTGMLENYEFITRETLSYFDKRPPQAQRDADFALNYVKRNAKTPEQQQAALAALSTNSQHMVVPGATHQSLIDNPTHAAVVNQAIVDVVEAIRTGAPLATQ
jgi:coenzyme PQQ biosynthesis protein C